MEPSTRHYNPSGQRAGKTRAAGTAKRQNAPAAARVQAAAERPAARVAKPRASRAAKVAAAPVKVTTVADELPAESVAPVDALRETHVAAPLAVAETVADDERADIEATLDDDFVSAPEPAPMIGVDDFDDIFTRFQTPIINFIYRLVGNREQAYDLAQDVFVKAYRALSGGATIQAGALSSWLYRIASNTATDALRRRRLISWLPLSLFNDDRGVGAGMPGSENGFGSQTLTEDHLASAMGAFTSGYDGGRFEQRVADREVVERVLKRLPEKYAACLLLYEHEGFSCAEIADVLHVTPSAVKMRLMRARERFISIYQQEMEGRS